MEVKEIKTVVDNLDDFIEVTDGIFRLRSMVLDLAVSGLLTEQDKSEGTADDLYKAIQREKEKISSTKKVKPLSPVAEEEVPFQIPNNWKWVRLGQISNYGSPKKVSPKNIKEGTLVVELEDIEKDSGRILLKRYYPDREVKSDRSFFDSNFVLYGKLRPYLNKVIVTDEPGVCSTELVPLEMFAGCNPFYLQLALMSGYFVRHVNELTYGVKMPRLGTSDGQNAPVPLPPLAEQKRIVERVDELMKLIDQLEVEKKERDEVRGKMAVSAFYSFGTEHNEFALKHLSELVKTPSDIDELEKSILSLAVSSKLTSQDPAEGKAEDLYQEIKKEKQKLDIGNKKTKPLLPISEKEIPFELPSSWKWVRLGELMIIERGGSPRPIKSFITDDEDGVNWIKIGDTKGDNKYISSTKEKIRKEGISRSREVKEGDFLLSNSMSFGRPYIMKTSGCIHDGWLLLRPLSDDIDKDFLYSLLSSTIVQSQFEAKAAGAVVRNLNIELVRPTIIPLPPVGEQKRIVTKVNELMALTNKLREVIND